MRQGRAGPTPAGPAAQAACWAGLEEPSGTARIIKLSPSRVSRADEMV